MTSSTTLTHIWRKDITGLRAIAVLPVLIFHAFPNLMPGGFYGVDIFFVISGYLISGIIFRGLVSNSFSFVDFYSRRIKRIIPNLLIVFLFVLAVGWFVTSASEYKIIAANVSHSAFFYQNFGLMGTQPYFGLDAQKNPLLHVWSLAIEEQFYLLFPLLCVLLWRIKTCQIKAVGVGVFVLTISSFVLCLMTDNQSTRFYFPLSRFWELGAGICLAFVEVFYGFSAQRYEHKSRDALSILGLSLIVVALVTPQSFYSEPPGFFSLFPVLGSVALIASGSSAIVNRSLLSVRFCVFVGLISYSLYLWHWPILVYLRGYFFTDAIYVLVFSLIVSFVVSAFVYKFIENPLRRARERSSTILIVSLLGLLCLFYASGKVIREYNGFPEREFAKIVSFKDDWVSFRSLKKSSASGLMVTDNAKTPEIVFLGDSHMEHYLPRILYLSEIKKVDVGVLSSGGCMVSIGVEKNEDACYKASSNLRDVINDPNLKKIVISQQWGGYRSNILTAGVDGYNDLIKLFMSKDPSRKVYVLLDVPWDESQNNEFDIFKFINGRVNIKEKLQSLNVVVNLPKDNTWLKGNEFVEKNITKTAKMIRVDDVLCPNGKCNLLNYKDRDHLRASFVKEKAYWVDQVFE